MFPSMLHAASTILQHARLTRCGCEIRTALQVACEVYIRTPDPIASDLHSC